MLVDDGQLRFAQSGNGGEREIYRSRSDAVWPGFNKLGILAQGSDFYLYANDVLVAIIPDEEITGGGVLPRVVNARCQNDRIAPPAHDPDNPIR
jgi:hypothetical protein